MIITEQTLEEMMGSPVGLLVVFAPLAVTLLCVILSEDRDTFLPWGLLLTQAAVLGFLFLVAYVGNENGADIVKYGMYLYYCGGAFLCWVFSTNPDTFVGSSGGGSSGGGSYLNDMTGDESGGIDTTGLTP